MAVTGSVFGATTDLPEQATVATLQTYRELFWRLLDGAEAELPGEARARGLKARDGLLLAHPVLEALSRPLEDEAAELVVTPEEVTLALAEWAKQFLAPLDVVSPGSAVAVVRTVTKEHRFQLQKAGFYQHLPWTITW